MKAEYVDENLPLPLTSKELGVYKIEVPPQTQAKKIKVRAKFTLHGTFVIEGTQMVEDEEYEETIKEKRELPAEPVPEVAETAEAKSLIASFSTMSNEPNPLVYETPEANVYEFHSSGIIVMLEKMQKKFDTELHDAQVGESNVAHASSMKVQDLTDAVANGQAGFSRSKEIISQLKQDVTTSTMDTKIAEMKTGSQDPVLQFAVNEQSEKFAPHGSETTSLHQLDETSLKGNVKERNAMIIELNDEKFYIIFAQFKQRQKEMENSPISQCLYLHKTENVADDVAKSQSVYDTMIKMFLNRTVKIQDDQLQTEDQNS